MVEALREQQADETRGITLSVPYTVDAAGNIYHRQIRSPGVSDEKLQHQSPQMTQEANNALAAVKAERDRINRR